MLLVLQGLPMAPNDKFTPSLSPPSPSLESLSATSAALTPLFRCCVKETLHISPAQHDKLALCKAISQIKFVLSEEFAKVFGPLKPNMLLFRSSSPCSRNNTTTTTTTVVVREDREPHKEGKSHRFLLQISSESCKSCGDPAARQPRNHFRPFFITPLTDFALHIKVQVHRSAIFLL